MEIGFFTAFQKILQHFLISYSIHRLELPLER